MWHYLPMSICSTYSIYTYLCVCVCVCVCVYVCVWLYVCYSGWSYSGFVCYLVQSWATTCFCAIVVICDCLFGDVMKQCIASDTSMYNSVLKCEKLSLYVVNVIYNIWGPFHHWYYWMFPPCYIDSSCVYFYWWSINRRCCIWYCLMLSMIHLYLTYSSHVFCIEDCCGSLLRFVCRFSCWCRLCCISEDFGVTKKFSIFHLILCIRTCFSIYVY